MQSPQRSRSHLHGFPAGIPEPILRGDHDHRLPWPGDGGVRYAPACWPPPSSPRYEARNTYTAGAAGGAMMPAMHPRKATVIGDVTRLAGAQLVTIPDVELVSIGQWKAWAGNGNINEGGLDAMVAAADPMHIGGDSEAQRQRPAAEAIKRVRRNTLQ